MGFSCFFPTNRGLFGDYFEGASSCTGSSEGIGKDVLRVYWLG
jgi:hypothetical protein